MFVICAVLVPYLSSQKGEFIFLGSAQYNYTYVCLTALLLEESILLVTLMQVLYYVLTLNIYDKSK